jgi:hypothetical protein
MVFSEVVIMLRCVSVLLIGACVFVCAVGLCAEPVPPPKPPEDISAEILKCDPNSCQVSDRLIGSMAGLPGSLVDLSSGDGQRLVRQADNFRKPGTHLQPSGEVKVMYHSWLDQTQARSASILGFLKASLDKNDRLEVRSTMLPGVSVLPEDLDYAKIAAAFRGKPQAEIDKYGIVMSVIVYEVSGALYNTSSRKIDVDWPCYSVAGGKSLLYKSGQETSQCFLMAVYAPIPFCIDLDALSKTPPDRKTPTQPSIASAFPDNNVPVDLSHITESGPVISLLLKAWVATHEPTLAISDSPRSVLMREAM